MFPGDSLFQTWFEVAIVVGEHGIQTTRSCGLEVCQKVGEHEAQRSLRPRFTQEHHEGLSGSRGIEHTERGLPLAAEVQRCLRGLPLTWVSAVMSDTKRCQPLAT